jgi:hypothetical protein
MQLMRSKNVKGEFMKSSYKTQGQKRKQDNRHYN